MLNLEQTFVYYQSFFAIYNNSLNADSMSIHFSEIKALEEEFESMEKILDADTNLMLGEDLDPQKEKVAELIHKISLEIEELRIEVERISFGSLIILIIAFIGFLLAWVEFL